MDKNLSARYFLLVLCGILVLGGAHGQQFEGDSCVRKYDDSPGECTAISSCPRVREESRRGVPVTFCAYLSGQAIICCPKSGGSSRPSWSQQQTQPAWNQQPRPSVPQQPRPSANLNTQSPWGQQSQSSWDEQPEPSKNQQTSFNPQKRISVEKCEKYAELTQDKVLVNPLILGGTSHSIAISNCDATTPLIVGGEKTKAGEYPHMAAIGWYTLDGSVEFKCGGTLISERFVLTAAHCGRADGKPPSLVRLGDQNLQSNDDRLRPIDVGISQFIKHENYRSSSYYFDIAVIRLSQDVKFTKTIRPACLWQSPTFNVTKTIATGWGYTKSVGGETSDELMKVELNIIDNQQCNRFFEDDKLEDGIVSSQMCCGVLSGGRDTCNGDSGGPVQITTPENRCLFHIIGVTSFGSPFCGQKNSPGVYTRVSSYIDWIEEKVWG